ncbi:uncharacterized protein J7T54_004862 [Emericellopsis cladophorae]|uniref:CBF1-interacting co-repressor CIR N-terminal domain-containing protein n=1 Tax=Emericellopsis cladophorae TaxID=2686198 RepID=A0A9P9Y6C4_9HYPO|nr:uncharacterized protein J7T54_004862 [Emericellopsis cladophorae]KAI6784316.1 hypothetical protein J7T54_004862 [Emericellopsis cladophorae]
MPLHLLGKKSWNVYNADNIARVRRDEAAAQAAEEAEEQRMQEVDAQRRLSILRGEIPPPLPETEEKPPVVEAVERREARGGQRKRKRPGEDDTDFELRIANERYESRPDEDVDLKHKTSSAPITDHAGHIDLFGDERARGRAEGNEEAEKEAKKKKQELEDQYTMRFANAAGRDGVQKPWYSNAGDGGTDAPPKNVWGKDDPQRRERDAQRTVSNDPLAMMRLGASKARQVNQERKRVQEERDAELRRLRREQEHAERRDVTMTDSITITGGIGRARREEAQLERDPEKTTMPDAVAVASLHTL